MSDSITRLQTIAVIGTGEMGVAVAQRMRERGARVLTTLKGRSAASVQRVKEANIEAVDEDMLARDAGFVLSIVPPGEALAVAERFRAPLSRAPEKPVFAECNAISPATARRVAELLRDSGCRFVDAGIIGGPPRGSYTPHIYASGEDAHMLICLRAYGLEILLVNGPIGAASALKMSYAGLTKGILAVGAAMIGGASRAGLASALHEELANSQPEMLAMFERRIPSIFSKAYRWVNEMEQIADFLGADGNGGPIYNGASQLYARIAEEYKSGGDANPSIAALLSFFKS